MKNIMVLLVLTVICTFAISLLGPAEDKEAEAPERMVLIPAGEFEMGSNNYRFYCKSKIGESSW